LDYRFFKYAEAVSILSQALEPSKEQLLGISGFFDEYDLTCLSHAGADILIEAEAHFDDLVGILLLAAAGKVQAQYKRSVIATLHRIAQEPSLLIDNADMIDAKTIAEIERHMRGNPRDPKCIVEASLTAISHLKTHLKRGQPPDHETGKLVPKLHGWFRKFDAKKRTRIVEKEPSRTKSKFVERGSALDFFDIVLPPLNEIVRAYGGRPFSQLVLSKKITRTA
jgi:hypothetical protein